MANNINHSIILTNMQDIFIILTISASSAQLVVATSTKNAQASRNIPTA